MTINQIRKFIENIDAAEDANDFFKCVDKMVDKIVMETKHELIHGGYSSEMSKIIAMTMANTKWNAIVALCEHHGENFITTLHKKANCVLLKDLVLYKIEREVKTYCNDWEYTISHIHLQNEATAAIQLNVQLDNHEKALAYLNNMREWIIKFTGIDIDAESETMQTPPIKWAIDLVNMDKKMKEEEENND